MSAEEGTEPDGESERGNGDVDEQEEESFPASDPHSDWAGPASEDD